MAILRMYLFINIFLFPNLITIGTISQAYGINAHILTLSFDIINVWGTLWNWIYEAVFQIGEAGLKLFVTIWPELGAISLYELVISDTSFKQSVIASLMKSSRCSMQINLISSLVLTGSSKAVQTSLCLLKCVYLRWGLPQTQAVQFFNGTAKELGHFWLCYTCIRNNTSLGSGSSIGA